MLKGNSSSTPMGRSDRDVDGGVGIDILLVLEMSGVFSALEPEIFLNIMSRVPLKSLSQCRWVCKSWYNLIKSPRFAKIQFEWAANNKFPCVFFWTRPKVFYLLDDQVFDDFETTRNLELNEFECNFHENVFGVVGYVNGLVCFASYLDYDHPSPFYICNPITGEHITVPKSPNIYTAIEESAFGFDPTTKEYKVIRFIQHENGEYSSLEGEVYTLGSSEWRKIEDVEDVPQFTDTMEGSVLVNGNIHWKSHMSGSLIVIVAFNVGAEKFHVIQPPSDMLQNGCKHLAVLEEHLCIVHNEAPCKPYEIWAMKDYGVQSSWAMKYSFSSNLFNGLYFGSNNLIKLRNGGLLLLCETQNDLIIFYDIKRETFKLFRENRLMEFTFQMVMQVGSLFSPKDVGISKREKV